MKRHGILGIGVLAVLGAAALLLAGCDGAASSGGAAPETATDAKSCGCGGGAKVAERLDKLEARVTALEAKVAKGLAAAPGGKASAAAPGGVPLIGVANSSKNTWKCVKVAAAPTVDGKLDDAAWKSAVQSQLVAEGGGRLANDGSVLLCHDGTNLYIAAICMETDMDKLKTNCTKRDDKIYGDDCVEFYIDVEMKKEKAVKFVVNANGVFMDFFRLAHGDGEDVTWNPVIKTDKGADRWVLEISVPLKDMGVEYKPGAAISFNALRMRQKAGGRSFEASTWWGRINKIDSLGKVNFE